jgi:hypothetical protein
MADVRQLHTDSRTVLTPAFPASAKAEPIRAEAMPRPRNRGSVQSRLTGERRTRLQDLPPIALRQPVHIRYRLALLGLRLQVIGRQQLAQPGPDGDVATQPAEPGNVGLIRHDASVTQPTRRTARRT